MSRYTIIHGELCRIDDNTLMHWKYIKKERVNGKWRYYYDLGRKTDSNDHLVKSYSGFEDWLGLDERDRVEQQKKLYNQDMANYNKFQKEFEPGVDDPSFGDEILNKAAARGKEVVEAQANFMKTPLGRLQQAKEDIKKAANTVSKALNKLGSKLKSLFKK